MTLTPTQEKIEELLSDGEPYLMEHIINRLDPHMEVKTFHNHAKNLRKKLREENRDIVSYRMMVGPFERTIYQIVTSPGALPE